MKCLIFLERIRKRLVADLRRNLAAGYPAFNLPLQHRLHVDGKLIHWKPDLAEKHLGKFIFLIILNDLLLRGLVIFKFL